MNIITLTKENIASEHICCAVSDDKDGQAASKKEWLSARLDDGLMFKKGDVRGKCFIEYIPAEKAWAPIIADGYMYINCFWVSGQFKGQGNGKLLLDECIRDSHEKSKNGLVVLSSSKKKPFLSDPKFLKYKGFLTADKAAPDYELMYLPFDNSAQAPRFTERAKTPHIDANGFVLYYSQQCPYTAKYVPLAKSIAEARNVPFEVIRFETAEQAQSSPAPFTTYSLFFNGELITHEIQSDKKLEKLIDELCR